MGRPTYPLTAEALAEAVRFAREGSRSSPRGFRSTAPSYRDIARHLRRRRLTEVPIDPGTLRGILLRIGVDRPRRAGGQR